MNGKPRRSRLLLVLSVCAVIFIGYAFSTVAVLRERKVQYWAWTYGDGVPAFRPENNCSCVVGPCPATYEIVGEKTYSCDGTTSEWGYVDYACTDTRLMLGPLCN